MNIVIDKKMPTFVALSALAALMNEDKRWPNVAQSIPCAIIRKAKYKNKMYKEHFSTSALLYTFEETSIYLCMGLHGELE